MSKTKLSKKCAFCHSRNNRGRLKFFSKYLPSPSNLSIRSYLTKIALSELNLLVNCLNGRSISKLDKEELEETSDPSNLIIFAKQKHGHNNAIIHRAAVRIKITKNYNLISNANYWNYKQICLVLFCSIRHGLYAI